MALSNILREPRREITESLVGMSMLALYFLVDWFWTAPAIANAVSNSRNHTEDFVFGLFMGFIGQLLVVIMVVLLLLFTHFIGEELCNVLAERGIELRPKNRPQQL